MKKIEHYPDLFASVAYSFEEEDMKVDFEAVKIALEHPGDRPIYQSEGGENVTSPEEAEQVAFGFVKWDGCAHYYIGDREEGRPGTDGYWHFDGRAGLTSRTTLLHRIYRRCGELMPSGSQEFTPEDLKKE